MNMEMLKNLDPSEFYLPALITIAVYLVLWVAKNVVVKRLHRVSKMTSTYLDDVFLRSLQETKHFFMIAVALYFGLSGLKLPPDINKVIYRVFLGLSALQIIIWGNKALDSWFGFLLKKKNDDPSVKMTFGFMSLLIKVSFVVAVILFTLSNYGVNVSTFVAGLGVGGVAIALATQNILGDLFSSLSIVLDKPFVVGDFISLGEWLGTIEHVGLKTTRLRSLSGEQIVISNTDLLSSKIRNYKRMEQRRAVFQVGLTYQTKHEDLVRVPQLIKDVIVREEMANFDRAHFVRYGNFSLDFEIVYWILDPDYNIYANVHERVLLEIHKVFEKNNLEFAYPTQTIFVEKTQA